MTMMILGELCNSAGVSPFLRHFLATHFFQPEAYAFIEAIVVTPLGALSVVICAILSSIFLKETLTIFGWLGCALCIVRNTYLQRLNHP
ncbi:magnesium transporter NIPA-domain-containing protein [Armillaria borealis]|uniref:Magnesium transporter NIPA-domain-containing protein n=1 Tax=Armillaria borealis TaxID=47425 RepID=A0AA39MVZ4_9AGAR|nr:magnesium transporter NIPA-domain-containing protein [Armillaria borealis]